MAQRAEQEQGIRLLLAAIHLGELSSFSRLFSHVSDRMVRTIVATVKMGFSKGPISVVV